MLETKQRIRIIGPPGSSAHVLARSIAQQAHTTFFDLDEYAFASDVVRSNALLLTTRGEKWIIVGSLAHEWAGRTVNDATMLFYVHTPLWKCRFRVWTHFLFGWLVGNPLSVKQFRHKKNILSNYLAKSQEWKRIYHVLNTKLIICDSVKEGYDYFVKATASDLFL